MRELIITERSNIVNVANAVRKRTGETDEMTLSEMVGDINVITTEPVLQDKTVSPTTSKQTINADSQYDGLNTVTVNAIPTTTQATPSITVSSDGLITASVEQSTGYVVGDTKSTTKQLATQVGKTITPSTTSQTAVVAGKYTTGEITVAPIPSEYTTTSDATAAPQDILKGETAYVNGEKITGTIETKTESDLTASGATVTVPMGYYTSSASKSVSTTTQATPSISVNSSGLITASATQSAGYVTSGTKSATKQLSTQAAQTITPSTSDKTIAAGKYLTGTQTIKGDANLKAENIAEGVSIFGVEGSHTGGIDTSDATAVASNILSGKTAYADGEKLTGTMTNNGTINSTMDGIDIKSVSIPAGYTSGGTVSLTDDIDNEVDTQADLIAQISTALADKSTNNGTDTSDATATAGDILSGRTAYVDGKKIVGTIVTKTENDLSASGAIVTVPAGYYANSVSKSVSVAMVYIGDAEPTSDVGNNGDIYIVRSE